MSAVAARKREVSDKRRRLPAANSVYCGDCHALLKLIPDASVDVVITSPPYFRQREYAGGGGIGMEHSVENYLESLMEGFSEIVRVIKPEGSVLYNLGDKIDGKKGTLLVPYQFAMLASRRHPEASLLNHIAWVKTNPTPRQFTRRLVSCHEPFFHFVKSSEYYYNPEEFMKVRERDLIPACEPGKAYFNKIAASELSPAEKEAAVLDLKKAIEEVKSGAITGFRMKIRGVHAPAFGGQEGGRNSQMRDRGYTIIRMHGNPMKKDALLFAVERVEKCPHPAIFPMAMVRELIKLTCPPGGVVLDPYCGSGTTLAAAKKERRNYIGMDISAEYCEYARRRAELA